jgi:hypothetical protein
MNDVSEENPRVDTDKTSGFLQEMDVFFEDGQVFDGYYQAEIQSGISPGQTGSQVSLRVEYEKTTQNIIGDDPSEQLLVPVISKKSVVICAPPVVPYVVDEVIPQELWEHVQSDDPSRAPTREEMKCIEIGIYNKNTFQNGVVKDHNDIYRIDVTGNQPVVYKRFPLPKSTYQRHDAMGLPEDDASTLSAILDIIQPLPVHTYKQVSPAILPELISTIRECRMG